MTQASPIAGLSYDDFKAGIGIAYGEGAENEPVEGYAGILDVAANRQQNPGDYYARSGSLFDVVSARRDSRSDYQFNAYGNERYNVGVGLAGAVARDPVGARNGAYGVQAQRAFAAMEGVFGPQPTMRGIVRGADEYQNNSTAGVKGVNLGPQLELQARNGAFQAGSHTFTLSDIAAAAVRSSAQGYADLPSAYGSLKSPTVPFGSGDFPEYGAPEDQGIRDLLGEYYSSLNTPSEGAGKGTGWGPISGGQSDAFLGGPDPGGDMLEAPPDYSDITSGMYPGGKADPDTSMAVHGNYPEGGPTESARGLNAAMIAAGLDQPDFGAEVFSGKPDYRGFPEWNPNDPGSGQNLPSMPWDGSVPTFGMPGATDEKMADGRWGASLGTSPTFDEGAPLPSNAFRTDYDAVAGHSRPDQYDDGNAISQPDNTGLFAPPAGNEPSWLDSNIFGPAAGAIADGFLGSPAAAPAAHTLPDMLGGAYRDAIGPSYDHPGDWGQDASAAQYSPSSPSDIDSSDMIGDSWREIFDSSSDTGRWDTFQTPEARDQAYQDIAPSFSPSGSYGSYSPPAPQATSIFDAPGYSAAVSAHAREQAAYDRATAAFGNPAGQATPQGRNTAAQNPSSPMGEDLGFGGSIPSGAAAFMPGAFASPALADAMMAASVAPAPSRQQQTAVALRDPGPAPTRAQFTTQQTASALAPQRQPQQPQQSQQQFAPPSDAVFDNSAYGQWLADLSNLVAADLAAMGIGPEGGGSSGGPPGGHGGDFYGANDPGSNWSGSG